MQPADGAATGVDQISSVIQFSRRIQNIAAIPFGGCIQSSADLARIFDVAIRDIHPGDLLDTFIQQRQGILARGALQVNGEFAPFTQLAQLFQVAPLDWVQVRFSSLQIADGIGNRSCIVDGAFIPALAVGLVPGPDFCITLRQFLSAISIIGFSVITVLVSPHGIPLNEEEIMRPQFFDHCSLLAPQSGGRWHSTLKQP
jgi:hypothetical protein